MNRPTTRRFVFAVTIFTCAVLTAIVAPSGALAVPQTSGKAGGIPSDNAPHVVLTPKPPVVTIPLRDATEVTAEEMYAAVLHAFPEAYEELGHATKEWGGDNGAMLPKEVKVLVANSKVGPLKDAAEQKARLKILHERLRIPLSPCAEINFDAAQSFAWSKWPEKRVVPLRVRFLVGC